MYNKSLKNQNKEMKLHSVQPWGEGWISDATKTFPSKITYTISINNVLWNL